MIGNKSFLRIINRNLQKYIPRIATRKSITFIHGETPRFSSNPEAFTKMVSQPAWNLLDRGGKRARAVFFLLLVDALGGSTKELSEFALIPEVMHNASLIIDDIEDDSKTRRNAPCVHKQFGIDVAINAAAIMAGLSGLTLLRTTSGKLKKLGEGALLAAYEANAQAGINIGIGQAMDIYLRGIVVEDPARVREADYLQSCAYRTGALLKLAAQLSAILAGRQELSKELGHFGEIMGTCFQIRDDILNLKGFTGGNAQDAGSDIREGNVTLPIIYALKDSSQKDELSKILCSKKKGKKSRRDVSRAIEIITQAGAIEKAARKAKRLLDSSWKRLERKGILDGDGPESGKRSIILKDYCYYLALERDH